MDNYTNDYVKLSHNITMAPMFIFLFIKTSKYYKRDITNERLAFAKCGYYSARGKTKSEWTITFVECGYYNGRNKSSKSSFLLGKKEQ